MTAAEAFAVLELDQATATSDEVKSRYRKLSLDHHPDRGGDMDKFLEVRTAYNVASLYLLTRPCDECEGEGRTVLGYHGFAPVYQACAKCGGAGKVKR